MNQLGKAYVDADRQLRTTTIGAASARSTARTDRRREAYWILSQVYDPATNSIRVVTV